MSIYHGGIIKTPEEINIMREGGKILAEILIEIKNMIKPGIQTIELENRFLKLCHEKNAVPACKGYNPYGTEPFPTGLCISINNQSVHCHPQKDIILNEGDIVTIDTTIKYKNLHVDSAFATGVGKISTKREKFLNTIEKAHNEAIKMIKEGIKTGDIAHTIQETVESQGYNPLREYAGHGIGYKMHEPPEIPCFGKAGSGHTLKAGMTICIEPLIASGNWKVRHSGPWDTKMADGSDFAQFEHTVLVTKTGYEILTKV